MHTIKSEEIISRIERYKALWGMWIENTSGGVIDFNSIHTVKTDIQSTASSDDIELGAVCSQSVSAEFVDDGTEFLGN